MLPIDGLHPFHEGPDCVSPNSGFDVQRFFITAADVVSPSVSRRPVSDSAMDIFCWSVRFCAMACMAPVVIAR